MLARRVSVTFMVDMKYSETPADASGIYLAGGGTFGVPSDNKMNQIGDSTMYVITYEVPAYTHHSYAFVNGDNTNWSGKENLNGKSCATGYYDDRAFEAAESDLTLGPFCFGKCCSCDDGAQKVTVTFKLSILNQAVSDEGIYLAGQVEQCCRISIHGAFIFESVAFVGAAIFACTVILVYTVSQHVHRLVAADRQQTYMRSGKAAYQR